jgi:hypothetical protein
MPDITRLPLFCSDFLGIVLSKMSTPLGDGFVADIYVSIRQNFIYIPKT